MAFRRRPDDEIYLLISSFKKQQEDAKVRHEWAMFHILQSYIDLLEWTLGEKELNVPSK
jgi:hypothetical protein